jgi:hypothetical protein
MVIFFVTDNGWNGGRRPVSVASIITKSTPKKFTSDGNRTKKHDLGYVTFYDADFVDPTTNEINFSSKMNNTKLSTYSFDQMEYHGLYKKKFQLSLSLDKSFYGRTVFSVRGFDRDKFTTKTLEVNAYILIAPWINTQHMTIISNTANVSKNVFTIFKLHF